MPDSSVFPPTRGPFTEAGPLAQGSTAKVLLAVDASGSAVALKRAHEHLRADPATQTGFRAEARWLSAARSPHVVRPVELLDEPGELCLVLEYVPGPSLAALLDAAARTLAPLPAPALVRIALDLLEGLAALHAAGEPGRRLLHRDLNPRNFLVGRDGVGLLCDLGLAAPEGQPLEQAPRGTLAYAAPEVIEGGPVDPRSDLFSAGVMLWEALRLERLFRGANDADTMRRVVEVEAPPAARERPDLGRLPELIEAMLQKDPRLRPPSASAARALLDGGHEPSFGRAALGARVESAAGELLRAREARLTDAALRSVEIL